MSTMFLLMLFLVFLFLLLVLCVEIKKLLLFKCLLESIWNVVFFLVFNILSKSGGGI